jgi:hypothetical protein
MAGAENSLIWSTRSTNRRTPMSTADQTSCAICEEKFEDDDIVIAYRIWPQSELLGHMGCVASISLEEVEDDEDDDD